MAFCPNIADNKVLRKFNKIIKEFGGKSLTRNEFKDSKLRSEKTGIDLEAMDMAYYVWDKYNGNEIPETKEDILKGLMTIDSEDSKNFLHLQNIMLSNQQKNTTAATNTKGEIKYNEKGEILAPNGKVSKLAKDIENLEGVKDKKQALKLYKQTRAQEFKDWFGDWINAPENSSKVVDENGEPLIVYHGTTAKFGTFKRVRGITDVTGIKGVDDFYFTSNRNLAKGYASKLNRIIKFLAGTLKADNWYDASILVNNTEEITQKDYDTIISDLDKEVNKYITQAENGDIKDNFKINGKYIHPLAVIEIAQYINNDFFKKIMPVFLRIKNPYTEENSTMDATLNEALYKHKSDNTIDGGIFTENNNSEFVTTNPNQIKSIFNNGEFSRENDNIYYQNNTNQSNEDYVASEKTIRDLAERMADRIGLKVKYISDRTQNFKGKLEGNTAIINLAYATLDTPIHEILGHPIIRTIKNNSTSTLYNNLLKELESGKGKEVLDRVKRGYQYKRQDLKIENGDWTSEYTYNITNKEPERIQKQNNIGEYVYVKNPKYEVLGSYKTKEEAEKALQKFTKYTLEEQQEEAIVQLLGEYTADRIQKGSKLWKLLKELLKKMKDHIKAIFKGREVEIDKLPDDMTLDNLADLLAYRNSKLILPGYEVKYTTPDNQTFKTYQEASKHISKLIKLGNVDLTSNNLKELQNKNKQLNIELEDIIVKRKEVRKALNQLEKKISHLKGNDYTTAYTKIKEDLGFFKLQNKEKEIQKLLINNIDQFISKNKEYEQSKEIIEEWKKVNNIKYDPEEVYSRGQGFYSVVGAYSNFDVKLMFQNLLKHIEDNKKSGGEFTISAFTRSIDTRLKHLEGIGGKIRFKIFPDSNDIKWAANQDVASGSITDAAEKVSKNTKSELIGVSYTKAPSLNNINAVQPNLVNIIDNLVGNHNELGIELTGNNFRLEYDDDIPYSTKKLLDNINSILDEKYGKLEEPKISDIASKTHTTKNTLLNPNNYKNIEEFDNAEAKELERIRMKLNKPNLTYKEAIKYLNQKKGKQPTQTKENLKKSIKSVKNGILGEDHQDLEDYGMFADTSKLNIKEKEYTSQAEINTKIAALKKGKQVFPRSLVRSEVVPINESFKIDTQYQKIPNQNEDNQNNEPPEIENIPSNEPFFDDYYEENPVDNMEMKMQSLDEAFNLSNLDPDEFSYMAGVQSKQKSWKEKYDALTKKQKTLVNEIRKRKRLLNRKLNNSKTKTEKALIQAKIDTINKQVWDILDNFDKIIGTAKWHLGHVETEFKKFINKDLSELSKKEIDASIEEINTLKNFINIWRDIDLLYPENDSVKEILALSTNLEHKFFILSKKYFLASAQKYDSSITEEKLYENQTDINKVTALELNSYHNNSLVAQHTTELIEKAQFEANKDARNAYNSLQDEYERAMQATGLTKQQLEEAVLDKDEEGKPVNRIIRRESLKFTETLIDKYKKRGKAINEVRKWKEIKENVGKIPKENRKVGIEEINKRIKQAEKQAKNAKNEFTQWLKDNTYSVTTDILNKLEKGEKINTTHFTANELRKQKQLLENYRADKRMFLMFELELDPSDKENAKLTEKELIAKVEQDDSKTLNYLDWEKQNSPFDALTAKQRRGSKYLIKSVPKEQWYNEEFTTLQKNKELYSFYNYILDYIEENNSHYPMSAQKDLEAYLPNVPKTQWEIITQSKVNKFLNIMGDDFIKSISSELDNSIEHSLIIDGKTLNNIPIKKSREIDREREKIDLFGSLKAQTVASRLYKFNTEVQPIAELADTILGNNETQKTTESGAYVKNVFRELFTEKGGAKNTRDQLRYTIDTYLYNKSRKKATWHLFKIFTKEEVEKLNKFSEDYTEELKDKLKNGIITQEEYDEAQKYNLDASDPRGSIRMFKQKLRKDLDNKKITQEEFDKKLSFVDKIGRKVTSNNLTDFAIKWTYLQALAFPNVFSPTVNLIQGMTTNIIHSARKSDFTFKELMQANRLIIKAVFTKTVQGKRKVTGDFKKILAFSQELGLIEDFNEHTKKSWVDKLSIFQQNAEWMNQVLTMVAMLKHLKINNEAGERSIWDNYTYDKRGDLVWDKENYGKEPQNSPLKIINEEGGVNLFKLKLRAQAVIEDIHGDYAHAMLAKNTNLGKILMLFRTWLPKAVELRTGKERFDSRLGRTRKGRYRSVIEGFKTQQGDRVSMGEFLLAFMPFKDSTLKFSDLSDVDQENVRANLSELAIIASIAMAILLTNLLGDDDDDSLTKSLKIFALNTMSRSLADVLFFLNPNSSYKVFDKVIPIYTPISNLFSITNVVIDSFTKGTNMQQGPFKDWNRFVKWGMINTPGLSGISKNISFSYKQYNMN